MGRKPVKQCTRNDQKKRPKWRLSMDLEPPVFAGRFVQLRARCKQKGKRNKKKIPFEIQIEKTLRKKVIPEGKDLKVPVFQETHTSGYATIFRRSNAKKNPHATLGTSTRML